MSISSSIDGDNESSIINDDSSIGTNTTIGDDGQLSVGSDGYDSDEFYGRDVPDGPTFNFEDDDELMNVRTKVQPEDWASKLVSDVGEDCTLVIDESMKEAWKQCEEDVELIRKNVKGLLNIDENNDKKIPLKEIFNLRC